jgi:hypothetical protein
MGALVPIWKFTKETLKKVQRGHDWEIGLEERFEKGKKKKFFIYS